jgi:steroid delta-isomerase-like uncharacterized protein
MMKGAMSMGTENCTTMQKAFMEIMQEGNVDYIDRVFARDFVGHDTTGNTFGRDEFRQGVLEMLGAFSDREVLIADQLADGDKVATRWIATALHSGDYRGIPATGRKGSLAGISIDRIVGGKIIESWDVTDDLGLMRQMGVAPGMEAAAGIAAD